MERVWQRIVEVGKSYAQRSERLSEQQARDTILAICKELGIDPPAADVLDYMAHALARRTK